MNLITDRERIRGKKQGEIGSTMIPSPRRPSLALFHLYEISSREQDAFFLSFHFRAPSALFETSGGKLHDFQRKENGIISADGSFVQH